MSEPPLAESPPATAAPIGIVGIGASAGGLAAMEQFLAQVPPASGLAYVVVQHLDPTHKGMLSELLQRCTAMPVREVQSAQDIQPNVVYVIAPNAELRVSGNHLCPALPTQPRGRRLPVDVLFSSMARERGARAVGVVLSGMGEDGTLGLQAIKSQGGLTLAQQPDSAQFDAMPRNAIAAGCVDIVAVPGDMPARIVALTRAPPLAGPAEAGVSEEAVAAADAAPLATILALVQEHTRHDLTLYKSNTLLRRIARRMAVHGLASMVAYEGFLRQNPQEIDLLFNEVLIGVTAFFRDPQVWQELTDAVLPPLLAQRGADDRQLRVWVAGCSTGEEAYSLAMVFAEVIESRPEFSDFTLQIFATDLSADAIAFARAGQYPAAIAHDVPPQRLARFFTQHAGGYLISPRIRETVLFAQHDVILDPPFTRLDLLSCRNLMIYFSAPLQHRLVALFHYSLRPGGVLLLGESETVGRSQALFTPLHPKSRIYSRNLRGGVIGAALFPTHRRPVAKMAAQETSLIHPYTLPVNLQSLADQVVLQLFSPAAVLVNESGDIVYINGRTGRYLEPAAGKANWNIHVMARPGIRAQLSVALRSALQARSPVELQGLKIDDEDTVLVDITVRPLAHPRALEGMVMIAFRDALPAQTARSRRARAAQGVDAAVSEELIRSREEIRALRQEMLASQEELQAANEELQSTNEELQSANEELTTAKEEAQSMNEELQTINGELQAKLDDLALAQSDMQNLLNSTDIATLFLDNELNVRRFTEQITRVIHLREGDVGRPLSELASTLIYPELYADVKETLRTLAFTEKQIATTDGQWFSVRIMPYRTLSNVIQGAVITFVDITTAKALESRLRKE
ncbi:chemotaxis protein CheB [Ideonella oryzae]|uniref:PAS domain-containing protein n=1 Tax=Ideonella oryzae TaxID=2937441 RepID=A0ABT1BH25_9BURK|nr:chemotaxis protein CheB [Ideonella oryzae]MCO5975525.1 PAS domain-containing protein [Ideonella oryzae]